MAGDTKLGTAQIPIRATLDELDKDLSGVRRHVEQALTGVQDLGKIALGGLAAGVLAVGGAIATIGPIAIDAASDLSESMNKADVVFGDSLKVIEDFAKTSASSFGISKQAAYEATGTFGNLFTALGMGKPEAANMSVGIAKLAADLGSFNNIPVDVALEKLRSGLVGETEPLRALGVNLTEAQVQAKALTMGLAKSAKELTPAMKVQARYALIMEQTTTAQGDFARTSDGLANTQKILGATFKDISADIGTAFLPLVLGVAQAVQPLVKAMMPKLQEVLAAVAPIAKMVGESFSGFVSSLIAGTDPLAAFQTLLSTLLPPDMMSTIMGIVTGVQEFLASIQPVIDQVTAWLAQNVSLQDMLIALGVAIAAVVIPAIWSVVAAAAPIVAAFIALVAVAALLRQAWTENWGGIRDTLTAFWEGTAKPALAQLWAWLSVNVPKAIQTLSDFWYNTMLPALNAVWQFIQVNVLPILAAVGTWLAVNVPAAIQTLADFWYNTLLPALGAVWTFINENVIPLFAALGNVYFAIVSKASEAMAGLWQNVLLPALTIVWQFIQTNVVPILMTLWTFLSATLGPIISTFAGVWLLGVQIAFQGIVNIVQSVIGWLNSLATSINNLTLPSWLTPGSPTPLEEGLTGVSGAAQQASTDLGVVLAAAIQYVGNVLKNDLDYWLGWDAGLLYLLKQVSVMSGQAMAWATKFEGAFYVMRAAIADAAAVAMGLLGALEDIKAIGTINTWVITHYKDVFEPSEDRTGGAPAGGSVGGGGGGPSGRQAGGPTAARTSYLVGEAGPEIFVPNMAGNIVPNARQFMNQLNSAMGRIVQATAASVSASMENMPELVARAGGGAGASPQQHVTIYGLTLEGVQDARGLLSELQAMT